MVAGLGTQASIGQAEGVREPLRNLLPDALGSQLSVRESLGGGRPAAAILVDRSGEAIERWFGNFDEEQVVELARAAS